MNCWEFMSCPSDTYEDCPAYPDKGLDCWKVTGTKCDKGRLQKASISQKVEHCRRCDFYNEFAHKF